MRGNAKPVVFDLYVDSVNGNDGNDGLTETTALRTIAATQTRLFSGAKIGLARGSYWQEMLKPAVQIRNIAAYGAGDSPIFDCADVINPASFALSAHPDAGGVVYQVTLTRDPNGVYRGQDNYLLFENNDWLVRVGSVALCAATPGTYFASPSAGASTTAYVHPFGSTNPTSDGKTYEASIRSAGIEAYNVVDNLTVEEVHNDRNLGHYGGITAGDYANIKRCLVSRSGIHGLIVKSGLMEDCVAFGLDPAMPGGIPFTFYETNPINASFEVRRCIVSTPGVVDVTGFYAHGSPNYHASGTIKGFLGNGRVWNAAITQENEDICMIGGRRALQVGIPATSFTARRIVAKAFNLNNLISLDGSAPGTIQHCAMYAEGDILTGTILSGINSSSLNITNNTMHAKVGGFFSITAGNVLHNIFLYERTTNTFITIRPAVASDYNVYVQVGSGIFIWRPDGSGPNYTTLAAWQAASGKDTNSVVLNLAQADTLFLNGVAGIDQGDFRLDPTCPLTFADGTPLVGNAGCQEKYDWNTRLVTAGQPSAWPVAPATQAEAADYIKNPAAWNFYPT
jgi:hypothetical protein